MVDRANDIPDIAITGDTDEVRAAELNRLRQLRERLAVHQTYWSHIHDEAREDDQFVAGRHWDEQIRKEREEQGRPMLTYNFMPSFTRQITNKVRQERPQMRVKPVESDRTQTPDISNVQGTSDYSLADVYMGIIRNIEHISRADHAYDTALQHAAEHGFGYFELRQVESRRNPFVQELRIKRIKDSYTIFLDPAAQEADFSDAQDGWKVVHMTRDAFDARYPGKVAEAEIGGLQGGTFEGWYDKEGVRVAEYFWVKHVDDEVIMMSNGKIHYVSDVEPVLDEMERDQGIYIIEEDGKQLRKAVKRPKCMWMKVSGLEILEPERELVFDQVPIFPVLGEERTLDGRTVYESAIRHAKDPQKSYNYHRTEQAERAGNRPKAPWILTEDQVAGHEDKWEKANRENQPYLPYNNEEGVNPPTRNFPEGPSAADAVIAQQDSADMQTIIGLHDANLGAEGNEKSGKAILARQAQGSTSTFTFPDNLNRALEACGRVMVRAVPRIYDTQRVVRIRLPDDTEDFVEINKMEKDEDTGAEHLVHDLGYGEYDVVVETGPSYATQRQEAVEVQMELLSSLPPELAGAVVHLIVENMGVPGSDKIAAMLRKMLPEHLKSEDERAADLPKGVIFDEQGNAVVEATGEPYQPPPTPEQQLAQEDQRIREKEADAKLAKADADMAKAAADKAEAETEMAQLQQPQGETEPQAGDYSELLPEIERIIQETMQAHEENPQAHADAMTEAVTEALKRVRSYVDGQLPTGEPGETPSTEPAEATQEQDREIDLALVYSNGRVSGVRGRSTVVPIRQEAEQ